MHASKFNFHLYQKRVEREDKERHFPQMIEPTKNYVKVEWKDKYPKLVIVYSLD